MSYTYIAHILTHLAHHNQVQARTINTNTNTPELYYTVHQNPPTQPTTHKLTELETQLNNLQNQLRYLEESIQNTDINAPSTN